MGIVEFNGGQINHRYLMKKSKDTLATMYADNRQHFDGGGELSRTELLALTKDQIASHVMKQFRLIWSKVGDQ